VETDGSDPRQKSNRIVTRERIRARDVLVFVGTIAVPRPLTLPYRPCFRAPQDLNFRTAAKPAKNRVENKKKNRERPPSARPAFAVRSAWRFVLRQRTDGSANLASTRISKALEVASVAREIDSPRRGSIGRQRGTSFRRTTGRGCSAERPRAPRAASHRSDAKRRLLARREKS